MTSQAFRLKLTRVNQLKLKVNARVPAQFEALTPIVLQKTNGAYTVSLDANALSAVQSVVAGSNVTVDNTDPRNPVVSASASGTGDFSSNTSSSVDGEIVLFSGTGGKTGKRATGSGLAKLTSGVLGTATAGTDYYNPGGTDVAIADGGTGQSTATAGFNALAPTTTRGDVIVRGATNNQRLALGTSGYFLGSDGTDAVWQGFLQSGTGATTRTWNAKARDIVSAKDFGVVADGSTTDTTNLQAAIDAAAAAGLALYLPSGRYKTGSLTLPSTGDVTIFGDGRTTVLVAATDGVTFFTMSDAFAATHKTFRGLSFDGNGGVNCRGISCTQTRETKVIDCHFEDLKYNVLVNECRGFWLSDISCLNSGAFYFHSTSDLGYCKDVMGVNIIDPIGTDINTTYSINAWFYLKDVVNGGLVNCSMAGMAGNTRCYSIAGKTEGVFLHNCVVGWPSVGLFMEGVAYVTQGATIYPQYCGFVNCGFDQPSVSSAVVVGDYNYMTGCWLANGTTRTNTGDGVTIKANTISFKMKDCYIAYHQKDGIKIESGATGVLIDGCDFTNNNGSAGSYYDIEAASAARADVKVVNCSPGLTSSIGNQIVVNGNTSSILSRNLTAASTTAVTTAVDLISFTIPANTFKVGQRVRIRVWGTVAANGNTKTGRVWFGSANLGGWTGALNNIGWKVDVEITITGSATQEYMRESITSSNQIARGDLTQDTTSTIVVKFQGQNGTASAGDIACEGMTVEVLN